jgi:hypothetical protein
VRRSVLPVAMVIACLVGACSAPLRADPFASQLALTSDPPSSRGPAADDSLAQVVQAYGDEHPDEFAGVYYEQDHGGRLVARFTGHLDVHQRALDALLGSSGRVVVLAARFTTATLQGIADSVFGNHDQLAAAGIFLMEGGVDIINNLVDLSVKSDDPNAGRTLQAYGSPGEVVLHVYPTDRPWTQPTQGPGWRLLGAFDTTSDLAYTVAIAVTAAQLGTEWERYGLSSSPPAWDPSREVAIILTDGIGSSCRDLRLDAVVVDVDARVVHGAFSDPHAPEVCYLDLVGGKTFVVAVARDLLPPSPFTLRLHADPMPCEPDCAMGPSTLQVDLR